MAITTAAHESFKDWIQGRISHGNYTVDGQVKEMQIYKLERSGDVITVQFYLDDTVSGNISKFQVLATDGTVFDDQPDSITKPSLNGLLVTFKYTIKRV